MTAARPWQDAEEHLGRHDPVMRALIERHGPCTLSPEGDLFGALCEAIIGQQVSVKAGASMVRRFRGLYDGDPSPAKVAATPDDTVKSAGISPQKTAYLKDLAVKCLDGTVDLYTLNSLPDDEVATGLLRVKGIGPWTVTMFLIFALNRPHVLPVGDLGLRRAVQNAYGLAELPDEPKLRQVAEPWHPYETVASWYLWRSLDNA